MKKTLHSLAVLLVWCLALAGGREARASHAQAGELTYFSLGNNQYRVRVTFFRDCGGLVNAPTSFALSCKNNGCNGPGSVTAMLLPPPGFPTSPASFNTFQPYCASVAATQPACGPNSSNTGALTNTISINYDGIVTLPPATEWVLSVEENARPTLANVSSGTLRLEATLNNSIMPLGGGAAVTLENNSPQFNQLTLPVPFVCWKQSSTLSFAATDVDRLNFSRPGAVGRSDSLVYSLDQPLNGCNRYEVYAAYPGAGCVPGIDPRCNSRIIRCSGLAPTYSALLPIAVTNDTTRGACTPGTTTFADVVPRFLFNAQAGSFRFTPSLYSTTQSNNKYAVVGKVTEYRKIVSAAYPNGRYYKVGSIRRDFLVIVIDCGNNVVPSPPGGAPSDPSSDPIIINNPDTLQLNVRSCNYTRIRVPITDPDNIVSPTNPVSQNQLLTVFPSANQINTTVLDPDIGNFSLSRNGTTAPVGTFFFQPSAGSVGSRTLITLRIEDNACPAKGIQYRTIVINVIAGQQAKAVVAGNATNSTICVGNSITLRGNVNRPDSIRQVASGRTILQRYSFNWSASNAVGNGLPAITNTQNLVVNPTTTTRYKLTITPTLGFAPGCGDTTSVLVRVAPKDSINFVVTDSLSNRPTKGGTRVPPISYRFKNTSFLSYPTTNAVTGKTEYLYANKLAPASGFKVDSVTWTYTYVKNAKGEMLNNSPVVFARTRDENQDPGTLILPPKNFPEMTGTYLITLRSSMFQTNALPNATRIDCGGQAKSRLVIVPTIDIYNIITPNDDGLNDTFVVGPQLQGGTLTIYNRWGRKVEELNNYQNDWKAANQGPGVYYYSLTDANGNVRKGWVEVVK